MIGRIAVAIPLTLAMVVTAQGAMIGFVSNPTGNSTDWTNSVIGLGGTVNTNVNFDTHSLGVLNNTFYSVSDGVTFSTTGPANTVQFGAGPGQANTSSSPLSPGEGVHPASNYLFADNGGSSLTITFADPVLGAGLSLVDLYNPLGENNVQLAAYTGPGGTGIHLGTVNAAHFNFQKNRIYFMGVVSTEGNIGSIRLFDPGTSVDDIGIDDIRFATAAVPEPASLTLIGLGAFGMAAGAIRRRRQNTAQRTDR